MSGSDTVSGWKLSTRRGRSQTPGSHQTVERSPSKLSRLFRGISDANSGPSSSSPTEITDNSGISTLNSNISSPNGHSDSRRNAVILDVDPEQLRPPSITDSISTSRFSIIFPPSPPLDSLQYSFKPLTEAKSEQNTSLDTLPRSTSKRFLPKFKGTPTRLFNLRKKQRTVSYEFDGEPLDGEEGELIDDEACFMDTFKTRGVGEASEFNQPISIAEACSDILHRLPDELSIYILLFVDIPEILSCLRVSRHWQRLAGDNIVWRGFYYRAGYSIDSHAVQEAGMTLQVPPPTPSTPSSPPLSSLARLAYYIPSIPSTRSLRTSITSNSTTHHSQESELQFVRRDASNSLSAPLAPLSLDWRTLYQTRLEISSRIANPDRPPALCKLLGHRDAVYCVEYDGETVITGSRDKTICVWSIKNFKPKLKMTLQGHQASVLCLQFDHTGCMVSGSSDSTVIVWDLTREEGAPGGRMVEVLREHRGGVLDIKMDSKWIVSCSKDTRICVWDRTTRQLHRTLVAHDGPVNAIGIQDNKVASVSGDGKMILWDIINGEKIRTFEGHERGLACVVYKGDMLISGSNDRKIKVWDARTGECIKTLSGHEHLVRSLSFDPGTMRLVSGSYDRSIRVWDVRTGKVLREFAHVHGSHIFDVVYRVSKIISASHDNQVIVMDFATDLDTSLFA